MITETGYLVGVSANSVEIMISLSIHSADEDATLNIWNLKTGELTQTISNIFCGSIGAISWIELENTAIKAFAFGCADGSIHIYRRKPSQVSFHDASRYDAHSVFSSAYVRLCHQHERARCRSGRHVF